MIETPTVLEVRDVEDIREAVAAANEGRTKIAVRGGGSKSAIGHPVEAATEIVLTKLCGIIDYEPAELVLTAAAGTSLADIEALLDRNGQMLAFEPMDFGPLFGSAERCGTIGGTIAANYSGPRRFAAGAARDHFLGFEAVSGRGEIFKGGGKVVKNVTGYDLPKLIAGSWGSLAILTRVTVRVTPRPRSSATLVLTGLCDRDAAMAMAKAVGSSTAVTGAAHLPAAPAAAVPIAALAAAGTSVTLLRSRGPLFFGHAAYQCAGKAVAALRHRFSSRRGRNARSVALPARRSALRRRHAAVVADLGSADEWLGGC